MFNKELKRYGGNKSQSRKAAYYYRVLYAFAQQYFHLLAPVIFAALCIFTAAEFASLFPSLISFLPFLSDFSSILFILFLTFFATPSINLAFFILFLSADTISSESSSSFFSFSKCSVYFSASENSFLRREISSFSTRSPIASAFLVSCLLESGVDPPTQEYALLSILYILVRSSLGVDTVSTLFLIIILKFLQSMLYKYYEKMIYSL